jgi:SAM-dependent methyltransferase
MTDIARHVRGQLVEDVLDYLLGHAPEIAEIAGRDEATLRARWSSLRPGGDDWLAVWRKGGISYRAPLDLTRNSLPEESADVIFSNDCLGYIPAPTLESLMNESARILRPGGFVAHDVTVYDDRTIQDGSIPPWGFLAYSEKDWGRIGNARLHFQNRLRPAQYARLATTHGLRMLYEERTMFDAQDAESIARSRLHPDYRDLPVEEILCRHYLFAAEKSSAASRDPWSASD